MALIGLLVSVRENGGEPDERGQEIRYTAAPAGLLGRRALDQILKSSYATWLSGTPSLLSSSRVALSMAGGPHR